MLFPDNRVLFTFEAFKRHFSKVNKAALAFDREETLSFHLEYNSEMDLRVENKIPEKDKLNPFIVLMRRFLNPLDHIYYKYVVLLIKYRFSDILPQENIEYLEMMVNRLNEGFDSIVADGRKFGNEEVYHILANGEYFNKSDEDAVKLLNEWSKTPFMNVILFKFYEYNFAAFRFCSFLLRRVLDITRSYEYKRLYSAILPSKNRCIFCLSENGPFTAEEHIVPEALGNYDTVLPEGFVCDICNNNILSQLDNNLVDSDIIGMLRVQFVPFTKAGRLPKAKYQNLSIEKVEPNRIVITEMTNRSSIKIEEKQEDGFTRFSAKFTGRKKFDARVIGRALYKIGLEMVAFHQNIDAACDSRYDAARKFVLNDQGFANNLLISKTIKPTSQVTWTYGPMITSTYGGSNEGTHVEMNIFGVVFVFNLEENSVLELEGDMKERFEIFSLKD